nr:hypothetical protein [Tanacetum cinerariifolium]
MIARGSVSPLSATALKGAIKHPQVLARFIKTLASNFDSLSPDVEEAHADHNMISNLHYPLLRDKLEFLNFDELVDVYDVHALQMAVVRNRERDFLLKKSEEVAILSSELEAVKLKKAILVRDFLPSAVKNLFVFENFNQALGDLQQKVITFGRSQALDEIHGFGDFFDVRDVQDYHPEAERIFNKATEAFYKLEYPYISLLANKASQSLKELVVVKALYIQENPFA